MLIKESRLADTFFVSKGLGASGLAALNLAIPIYSFVHGSGLMLGMGGATKYSIYMGHGELKNANKIYLNTIYAAAVFAVIFVAMGIFFSGKLAFLLGTDQEIFAMTKTYLQVILLFAPAFIANDCLLCFVRNDRNPKLSRGFIIIIPMAFFLSFPFKMIGAWVSYPFTEGIVALAGMVLYKKSGGN